MLPKIMWEVWPGHKSFPSQLVSGLRIGNYYQRYVTCLWDWDITPPEYLQEHVLEHARAHVEAYDGSK